MLLAGQPAAGLHAGSINIKTAWAPMHMMYCTHWVQVCTLKVI